MQIVFLKLDYNKDKNKKMKRLDKMKKTQHIRLYIKNLIIKRKM